MLFRSLFADLVNFEVNLKRLRCLKLSGQNIHEILFSFHTCYYLNFGGIPFFENNLFLRLFNTYRSNFDIENLVFTSRVHKDDRGVLIENLNYKAGSSSFISTINKNKVRGNHFHTIKIERFRFFGGNIDVTIRKLFDDKCYKFNFNSSLENFIDIPTYFTHSIINNDSMPALGVFSSIPRFKKNSPDTYQENVL